MTTRHYLYPEGISLHKDKQCNGKKKYAFGICGGEINILDDSTKRVEDLKWGNNPMDFISKRSNSSLMLDFDDLYYDPIVTNAYYDKPEEIVQVTKAAIFQSLIYNAYSVKNTYDFYNKPEILVQNGYIKDLNISILNNLQNVVIRRTMDVLNENNRIAEAIQLSTDNMSKLISDDVIWFSYEYDISEFTIRRNNTIAFLIGWTIKSVNNLKYIDGEVYKPGVYDVKLFKLEDKTNSISESRTSNDGKFSFKVVKPYENNKMYITSLSSIGNYLSSIILPDEVPIKLNQISTIIAEFCNENSNIGYETIKQKILNNLGISWENNNHNRFNRYIEIMIIYISSYVGNKREIACLVGRYIYEYNTEVNFIDKSFSERYITQIEDSYGIIGNSEKMVENLWLSIQNIENGNNVLKTMELIESIPVIRTSMYTLKYNIDLDKKTKGTTVKSPIHFLIYSADANTPNFEFYPNEFSVDWEGNKPISTGASTIIFKNDPQKKIRIVPNSKRAKKYVWLNGKTHTMETLLKGLFGEMMLSTSIVPAERTKDDSGVDGNEPYNGYITTKSLIRSIVQSPSSYFKTENANIVSELTKYYRMLWTEDEEAYSNILTTETKKGVFTRGDILEIPVDVRMRYNMRGLFGQKTPDKRITMDEMFSFMFNFKVC
jgi:hypothetical protein